jgi:hypothetical protein
MGFARASLRRLILSCATALVVTSCGDDEETTQPEGDLTYESVVARGGVYETVTPSESAEALDPETTTDDDGTVWECDVTHYTMLDAPEDYHTFNPNADVIYPGSLLQGSSIHRSNPTPIAVPRGGGTVVINSTNGDEVTHVTVDEVSLSKITSAVNTLISAHSGNLPMRLSLDMHHVSSFEELAFRLGVNVSTFTVDFKSQLSFSTDKTYNRYVVKLTQQYYTIMFQTPTSLGDFFSSDATPAQLAQYVSSGNPATYIASVTYGRAFYLLVESTATRTEMETALDLTYDKIVDVNVDAEANWVRELSDSRLHMFVMGGDSPDQVLALFQGDISSLEDYIVNGGDIETGVPLSYTLRNLADNSPVGVKVATEYDVLDCEIVTVGDRHSSFDTGTRDGWFTYGGGVNLECTNEPDGGHGYYLQAEDGVGGDYWYFAAPTKFTGDWRELFGGTLTYYAWISSSSDLLTGRPDIVIEGTQGRRIRLRYADQSLPYPNASGFTRYDILLDSSMAWVYEQPGISARPASDQDILDVFSNVDAFRIRGEYTSGSDWARVDEIQLVRPE